MGTGRRREEGGFLGGKAITGLLPRGKPGPRFGHFVRLTGSAASPPLLLLTTKSSLPSTRGTSSQQSAGQSNQLVSPLVSSTVASEACHWVSPSTETGFSAPGVELCCYCVVPSRHAFPYFYQWHNAVQWRVRRLLELQLLVEMAAAWDSCWGV